MNDLQLFDGISAENRAAMMSCFKPEQRSFRRGETIRVYAPELEQLCLLASGRAHLYCMDSDGEYTLLEQYRAGDIFGEIFSMPYADLGYAVEADCDCSVLFIPFASIYGRCPKACEHHTKLTQNLFELSARKAQTLAMRINMISKKSMRRKLRVFRLSQRERRQPQLQSRDIADSARRIPLRRPQQHDARAALHGGLRNHPPRRTAH